MPDFGSWLDNVNVWMYTSRHQLGGSKEMALGLFIKCWIWDKNKVGILTPDLEYEGRR